MTTFKGGLTRDKLMVGGDRFRLVLERTLAGKLFPGITSGFGTRPGSFSELWGEVGNEILTVVSPRPGAGDVAVFDVRTDNAGTGRRLGEIVDRFEQRMGQWGKVFSVEPLKATQLSEKTAPSDRAETERQASAAGAGRINVGDLGFDLPSLFPIMVIVLAVAAVVVVPRFFRVKGA